MAIHLSDHDPFSNADTQARADWYGIEGVPSVQIDGLPCGIGGWYGCAPSYYWYLDVYYARMAATLGESPIRIDGTFRIAGSSGTISAAYTLIDPAPPGELQATLFVYEDDITWCCGYGGADHWDQIVRLVASEPVSLVNPGDQVVVNKDFNIPPDWNPAKLHAVALIERAGDLKGGIQAARIDPKDLALDVPRPVRSVPAGNGTAWFDGSVRNVGGVPDQITLSLDDGFGWPAELQIPGDPDWYTSRTVSLLPGAAAQIAVRVRTDGERRVGTGRLTASSFHTGRAQSDSLRVFNRSCSILFVDGDQGGSDRGIPYDEPFVHAFDALGLLDQDWDLSAGHHGIGPNEADMAGFDTVIWETGAVLNVAIRPEDLRSVERYLVAGGTLYLDGMDFLNGLPNWNRFVSGYLGLTSWLQNTRCHTAGGAAGDPITSGMTLPLTFSSEDLNRVDTTTPAAGATAILFSEHAPPHPNAVRFESGGFRTVFSTIPLVAISETDPAPNNSRTLIQRIVTWLTGVQPGAVAGPPAAAPGAFLLARPDPFSAWTDLRYSVPPAAGAVRLTLLDPTGRCVRTLAGGGSEGGARVVRWNGADDAGRPLASGVYFARLQSGDRTLIRKLILIR